MFSTWSLIVRSTLQIKKLKCQLQEANKLFCWWWFVSSISIGAIFETVHFVLKSFMEGDSLLYTCIKHYIYDDALLSSIDTCLGSIVAKIYSVEKFQIGHVAARPDQTLARTFTSGSWRIIWLAQSATKETRYLCYSFACTSSKEKTLSSVKVPSFAVTGLPRVSLLSDLILFRGSCEALPLACS